MRTGDNAVPILERCYVSRACSTYYSSTILGNPAGHWMCGRLPVVSCSCAPVADRGATPTLTVILIIRIENVCCTQFKKRLVCLCVSTCVNFNKYLMRYF